MSAHTPGPWYVNEDERAVSASPYGPRDSLNVCFFGNMKAPDVIADARLIAAAPDLLEALREARAFVQFNADLSEHGVNSNLVDMQGRVITPEGVLACVDAAIAKATQQ